MFFFACTSITVYELLMKDDTTGSLEDFLILIRDSPITATFILFFLVFAVILNVIVAMRVKAAMKELKKKGPNEDAEYIAAIDRNQTEFNDGYEITKNLKV
jgi:hypothetical protein